MTNDSRRHDRILGLAGFLACPAISGVFLGLVAIVCAYPADGTDALALGVRVAELAFAANAFAIAFTACALHLHAGHRARREAEIALQASSH